VVFLESTYGNRDHKPYTETVAEFESLIRQIVQEKGKILVPTFAIGRSQQILYHLALMFHRKLVEPFHVYLDSPMAFEAGKAMVKYPDLFDEEMLEFKRRGLLPLDKKWFHPVPTPRESQALNDIEGPCVILAGAGMCNGGRILHHFRANLWKENTHVMIVGYQGRGSLGRRLVENAKSVSIYGEKVLVRARIHTLNGFSAHAGQSDLLRWFSSIALSRPRVVLTHGEDIARKALSHRIRQRFGLASELPAQGDVIEISGAEHALARTA
jgi:metallo-beta-lactamase family protein